MNLDLGLLHYGSKKKKREREINLIQRLKLRLGVHKRMEWNDYKGMKQNGMYLSKGEEWKRMKWNGIK